MRTSDLLRAAADALIAVTLAPGCAACRRLLDHPAAGPVCAACWSSVRVLAPPYCRTCGDPLPSWRLVSVSMEQCARCRRQDLAIACGRSAGEYEGALREIIHAFKYEGQTLARLAPRQVDVRRRERDSSRRALCRAGAAAPMAPHATRLQSGGRSRGRDTAAGCARPLETSGNGPPDGAERRGTAPERSRCVLPLTAALASTSRVLAPRPRGAADR